MSLTDDCVNTPLKESVHVKCSRCGNKINGILQDVGVDIEKNMIIFEVTIAPCQTCLDNIKNAAYAEGRDDGLELAETIQGSR